MTFWEYKKKLIAQPEKLLGKAVAHDESKGHPYKKQPKVMRFLPSK